MKYTVFVELLSGNYTHINLNDWNKAVSSLTDLVKSNNYKQAIIKDNDNNTVVLSLKEVQ